MEYSRAPMLSSPSEGMPDRNIDPQLLEYDNTARLHTDRVIRVQDEQDRVQHETQLQLEHVAQNPTVEVGGWVMDVTAPMPDATQQLFDSDRDMLAEVESDAMRHPESANIYMQAASWASQLPMGHAFLPSHALPMELEPYHHYPPPPARLMEPETPLRQNYYPSDHLITPPASDRPLGLNPEAPDFVPHRLLPHTLLITPPSYGLDSHHAGPATAGLARNNHGLVTPSSSNTHSMPHRSSRVIKRVKGRSVNGTLPFNPSATAEHPIDVVKWTNGMPNRLHHANQADERLALPGPTRRPKTASISHSVKSYACPSEHCDRQFDKRSDMEHHRRYHEDKRHFCSLCNSGFHFNKDLKRHMKTHSPHERHLMCTVLGCPYNTKGFQRQDHLKRHMQKVHLHAGGSKNT